MRSGSGNEAISLYIPIAGADELFTREIPAHHETACFRAIAEICCDEFIPNAVEGVPHIVAAGAGRFVLRKLLQADSRRRRSGEGGGPPMLSDSIADLVPADQLGLFTAINSGCFALLEMAKSGSVNARAAVLRAVNTSSLRQSALVGAGALLTELQNGSGGGDNKCNSSVSAAALESEAALQERQKEKDGGERAKADSFTEKDEGSEQFRSHIDADADAEDVAAVEEHRNFGQKQKGAKEKHIFNGTSCDNLLMPFFFVLFQKTKKIN